VFIFLQISLSFFMSIRSNPDQPQDELFRSHIENMIDMNHPLEKLGQGIDQEVLDREFG
jgi:hypothetical protein